MYHCISFNVSSLEVKAVVHPGCFCGLVASTGLPYLQGKVFPTKAYFFETGVLFPSELQMAGRLLSIN